MTSRRKYLTTISTTMCGVALAGCSSNDGDDSSGGSDGRNSDGGDDSSGGSDGGNSDSVDDESGDDSSTQQNQQDDSKSSEAQEKAVVEGWWGDGGNLVVTSYETGTDDNSLTVDITGIVENLSDKEYDYVQIEFAAYDQTEARIADVFDNTSGLRAKGRWRFNATGFIDDSSNVDSLYFEGFSGF